MKSKYAYRPESPIKGEIDENCFEARRIRGVQGRGAGGTPLFLFCSKERIASTKEGCLPACFYHAQRAPSRLIKTHC